MKDFNSIEDLLVDDSFVSWILGNATDNETKFWEDWLAQDAANQNLVKEAKEIVLSVNTKNSRAIPNPQLELAKFEKKIEDYEEKNQDEPFNTKRASFKSKPLAIAASLFLLVTIITGYYFSIQFNQPTKYQTALGEKMSVNLKDGSVIMLNSNSELKYTSGTGAEGIKQIDVWLKGEAYFKVPHYTGDKKRRFRVHTKDGIVEDLGTTFTVMTSPQETRAVLESGKIRILVQDDSGKNINEVIMKPNEKAQFKSGIESVDLERVNPLVYTSWTENKFVFDNTPFSRVSQRIESTFGLQVVVRDEKVNDKKLTGSIKSTNIEILKRALSNILDVPVQQKPDTLLIGAPASQ